MTTSTPQDTRVRVCGAYTEAAAAELADLSLAYTSDVDEADAPAWQQRTLDMVLGFIRSLAPGIPPTQLASKSRVHVAHPGPDAPVAAFTVTGARITTTGPVSTVVSKTGGSFLASSKPALKSGRKTVASLAMTVTFRDPRVAEEFTRLLTAAPPDVTVESITWRLTAHTARRVRRAARSGAVGEAYERAWDLAGAAIAQTGAPPDTPGPSPLLHSHAHAQAAPGFTLEAASVADSAESAAPSLAVTPPLRRYHKSVAANDLPLDKAAFEPPQIAFTAEVSVEYIVRTP